MKIQLQNTTFYPATGGIENYLYYASKTLLKMEHEPTILCSQHQPNLSIKEIYENIEIIRHPVYHIPKPLFVFNLVYYIKKLQKFIKTNSKDIDVILSRHPYYCYATNKALTKVPTFFIQASVYAYLQKKYPYPANNWIIETTRKKLWAPQIYSIEKNALEECTKVVVFSQTMKKHSSDYYNISHQKFEIIPPGVDLCDFMSRKKDKTLMEELQLPMNAKVILTVCRLAPAKNLINLVKAFKMINPQNEYLVIVGDGPERTKLLEFSKKLEILDRIRIIGRRMDVKRFYSIADLFVLPSVYEPFGQVYLEAMASGVPCIALKSDYPNIIVASEEIIRDGQTGYCANPYSLEDLAEKIERIVSNDELRYQMGQESRETCEKKYSWEKHVEALIKVVEDIRRDE